MIRRVILILLTCLLLLAAGWTTAVFVFRQPTPLAFEAADTARPVKLPCDEVAHGRVTQEWWYYTGVLERDNGQELGFELVFFKVFLPPTVRIGGAVPINWIANPLQFAHFAISDPEMGEHEFFSAANAPRFWQAGAREDRYEVWNGGWRAWSDMQAQGDMTCTGGDRHYVRAAAGRYALRLDLEAAKPPVAHGLDQSGVIDMGQAGTSYYYSFPDLRGLGFLTIDGQREVVRGRAWMDHQWGSWTGHSGFAGWDWFSLRLDDETQVMLFGFRDEDGTVQAESSGTWIAADGSAQHLTAAEMQVQAEEWWTSSATGRRYPVKWHITIPSQGLDVTVDAVLDDQEVVTGLGPTYWEGLVAVTGTASGDGYVELTGY